MQPHRKISLIILILLLINVSGNSQTAPSRLDWWKEASFGILFHWGLYAVPAGELGGQPIDGPGEMIMKTANIPVADYEKFATEFNPQSFHAREWVTLAKNAGAKYIIITAKHLDGFCMWDSKLTEYDVVQAAAYRRDVVAALSVACKEAGLRFGVYYALEDWHHPQANAKGWNNYLEKYVKPQLKELVENYPTDILMLREGPEGLWNKQDAEKLYEYLYTLKPSLIINSADYVSTQSISSANLATPTEFLATINDTWGFKNNDGNWKSSKSLINSLVEINAAGGNLLLNVGPKSFGTMAPETLFRIYEIGAWMKQNGEPVYKALPYEAPESSSTLKLMKSRDGKWLYAFLLDPKTKSFKVSGFKLRKGIKPIVLGTTKPVEISESKGTYTLTLPKDYSPEYVAVIKIPVSN
jgi:alpha-L-fucosidase